MRHAPRMKSGSVSVLLCAFSPIARCRRSFIIEFVACVNIIANKKPPQWERPYALYVPPNAAGLHYCTTVLIFASRISCVLCCLFARIKLSRLTAPSATYFKIASHDAAEARLTLFAQKTNAPRPNRPRLRFKFDMAIDG